VIKEYLPSSQATRTEGESVESLTAETDGSFRQGMRRFFEEAAALAKLQHPNIVRVTDFFRENNTVYIVMEHEEGMDLRVYLKRQGGRMSEKFIRTVFVQLLDGLREIHKLGLLHLDIKPSNIWLRPGGRPLLLDFGAAQSAFKGNKRAGAHTLTIGFAPIEQHRRGHIGPWTDLYAIGASMWACMSGRAPIAAPERAVRDKLKPAVKQFKQYYSRPLLEAVDWCLHMNQLERPQNVDELAALLGQTPAAHAAANGASPSLLERLKLKWPWPKKDAVP
ncbi:MAG TPA: serine/threonine-protein kinase, partial [Burkholderiaceae bacterium]|nr:serine/threonine-protein kinase [Burkholderiaceae bacterium]